VPYLTLTPNAGGGATTIRVLVASAPNERPQEIGGLSVAFGGATHDSRRGRVRRWLGVQTIVASATGATLKSLLEGTQPLTANGDLTGSSVPVFCTSPEIQGVIPGYVRLQWDMWEDEP
jgi:hypothetical protein